MATFVVDEPSEYCSVQTPSSPVICHPFHLPPRLRSGAKQHRNIVVIGGLKCPYFSLHSDCELTSREEELGREEDEGVGDLLQVREGEDGRRLRGKNAMLLILHLLQTFAVTLPLCPNPLTCAQRKSPTKRFCLYLSKIATTAFYYIPSFRCGPPPNRGCRNPPWRETTRSGKIVD